MKRTIWSVILVIVFAFCLTACGCEHEWKDATCTAPKTCTLCDATEGEVAPHQWQDATCLAPMTCKDCGATEGDVADHVWKEATCTAAKTCETCGETEGEALGHTWADATCTEPKTCSVCAEQEGEALGHKSGNWTVDKEATCTETGSESSVCSVCGETVSQEIAMLEHTPGEWEVKVAATITKDGTEIQRCTACETELDSRSYELPPFDYTKLKSKWRFSYDEFDKSWKYFAQYDKPYSNADEFINIIVFSEEGGARVSDFEIRAGLSWKGVDKDREQWVVEGLEVLVDGKVYSFTMTESSYKTFSYSVLYNDTSYQFIQDVAAANTLKVKIYYDGHGTTELDLGSNPFKAFCKDVVDYNLWAYYTPSLGLSNSDTTTVR